MLKQFVAELNKHIMSKNIILNADMSKHCTLRLGGNADILVNAGSENDVINTINFANKFNLPFYVIGKGSNIFVLSGGFRGVIIKISKAMADINVDGEFIKAQSGAGLALLSQKAQALSLEGLEFAGGIPGTVGGAVYMNAGAYGSEIKNLFVSAQIVDEAGNIKTLLNEDMAFDYRSSILQQSKAIVLSSIFKLKSGNINTIKSRANEYKTKRLASQPIGIPSCGSTFKRPLNNIAAKLIDDCGLKAYRVGGCSVSTKHAGFLVNDNNGTADDYYKLIYDVKNIVFKKTGIELETEVRILGEIGG